jgi:hypothetical protein
LRLTAGLPYTLRLSGQFPSVKQKGFPGTTQGISVLNGAQGGSRHQPALPADRWMGIRFTTNCFFGEKSHMPTSKYENQTIVGQIFRVEECWFVNCVLKNCVLYYSGGAFELENSRMENCQWKFQGPAQQTIALMTSIGLLPIQPSQIQTSLRPSSGPVN